MLIYIVVLLFSLGCDKDNNNPSDNPCDALVNGVYQYPEVPENHNWTIEQVNEYVNLPEDICECISTDGLIKSCLNYPYLSLIMAGSTIQNGYELVKGQFRGLVELEGRDDATTCLLNYYQLIDPQSYNPEWEELEIIYFMIDILYFEVIFSQYSFLSQINDDEIISLIEISLEKYEQRINDDMFLLFGSQGSLFILSRLMYINNYPPFMDIYDLNPSFVFLVNELQLTDSFQTADAIISLSNEYLETLKRNQNEI